jgi:hypothetical protein
MRDGQVYVPEKTQQSSWFKHGVRERGINKNKNVGREWGGGETKATQNQHVPDTKLKNQLSNCRLT